MATTDENKDPIKRLNVSDFIKNKTVKLSDSYVVWIRQDGKDSDADSTYVFQTIGESGVGEEMYNCVSVRLPMYKPNTNEVIKYKNKTVKLKMPNYEDVENLSLTFWETSEFSMMKLLNSLMGIHGMAENKHAPYGYAPHRYISEIRVEILNNALNEVKAKYTFNKLRLVNYSYDYQFDYTASTLPLVTMEFSYESYKFEA